MNIKLSITVHQNSAPTSWASGARESQDKTKESPLDNRSAGTQRTWSSQFLSVVEFCQCKLCKLQVLFTVKDAVSTSFTLFWTSLSSIWSLILLSGSPRQEYHISFRVSSYKGPSSLMSKCQNCWIGISVFVNICDLLLLYKMARFVVSYPVENLNLAISILYLKWPLSIFVSI